MADPTDASHEDNWLGGYYELSIKLGPYDDDRLDVALRSLWHAAALGQPFRRADTRLGMKPAEVSATELLAGHLDAIATVPGLGRTLSTVLVIREETWEGGETTYGADWLDLSLPLGALGHLDPRVGRLSVR